jgi:Pentapeptide repeats (8 copies)
VSDMRDEGTSGPPNDWKQDEKDLREQEIKIQRDGIQIQRQGTRVQAFTAIAAVAAALAAVYISINAREAIDVAEESVQRQAEENRIATAVDAIKSEGPVAQRVAGLTLLQRQAIQKLERANEGGASEVDRRDALNFFRSSLKVLESYIRDPVSSSPDQVVSEDRNPPRDVHSAGRNMMVMLTRKSLFHAVSGGELSQVNYKSLFDYVSGNGGSDRGELSELDREPPDVDLNNANLYGVFLGRIDMSWLSADNFIGIDLRSGILTRSSWQGTHLRCANLRDADMRGANLIKADLRHAELVGAKLQGAKFDRAKIAGADFTGATIDPGALDNANGRDQAVGLGEQPQSPPPAPPPECDAAIAVR